MLDLLGPRGLGISGEYIEVWLLHTGFGMPLAIYILRNYMTTLAKTVISSAKIDGATHYQTFWKLIVPMSVPALAAFAILQFPLGMERPADRQAVLDLRQRHGDRRAGGLLGTQGRGLKLLTAGAFISMAVPLVVFFSLQRYVRGLTAGAEKG